MSQKKIRKVLHHSKPITRHTKCFRISDMIKKILFFAQNRQVDKYKINCFGLHVKK